MKFIMTEDADQNDATIIYMKFNSFGVNRSGASSKKTGVLVLLNTLDSTRFYVGSYARDARLRPSRRSNSFRRWQPSPPGGSGGHGPPPSSARTLLASGGPWAPSVLRV